MPISYDSKQKLFHLYTNNISYYFFINDHGILQHLYFGRKINQIEKESIIDLGWDWSKTYLSTADEEMVYSGYYSEKSMSEIASHGDSDKRGAPIVLEFNNKSRKTKFYYVSHSIYNGKKNDEVLPMSFGSNDVIETAELVLEDESKKVRLYLSYSVFNDCDVIARNIRIENISSESISLLRAYTLQLDLPEIDYDLIHFHGEWTMERYFDRRPLGDGTYCISSNYGRSSHEENPFMILCGKDCGEERGEAYGFALVYSGNFSFKAHIDKVHNTRVLFGINDEDFSWDLKEPFIAPEVIMTYSYQGFEKISHNMHDLVRDHIITYPDAKEKRAVLFNSWEGCFLDFNTQTILDYMESASEIGAELFVLDDGWFGERNDDDRSLGDWVINEKKVDFQKIIDKCHKLKMKFGLWFEPEMINPNSDLYRQHPEYALGDRNDIRSLSRHQLVLDTANSEAVENIYEQMCYVLDKYEIDYIKWDHNRNIGEIHSSAAYGEVYHRLILGTYSLFRRLQKRYPHIFFENCASGGGRFDLGMLYFSPQIWTSDETDPVQRLFIQYGTSFMYPLSSQGAHISKSEITNYQTKGNIALFGTYGMEMNPCLLDENEKKEIIEVTKIYHKYHNKVIQNGDLYRLLSPFDHKMMSMMSVSKDKKQALVLLVNLLKDSNHYRFLKLRGLDENKLYKNNYDNLIHTGQYYMQVGLNFTKTLAEFQSFLVIIEEA